MAVVGTNWKAGLIRWKPHVTSDAVYSLAHLHPFRFPYQLSASSRYPETLVEIRVGFTIHCFTRSPGQNEEALVEARYGDGRENRIFDISRYQLSFALPGIIRSLSGRKCYFAKSENYLIVESQITADTIVQYGVFFDLRSRKLDGLKVIELIVQSAYSLNEQRLDSSRGRISFSALVGHALRGSKPRRLQ